MSGAIPLAEARGYSYMALSELIRYHKTVSYPAGGQSLDYSFIALSKPSKV
jgi:hypothetical protein